MVKKKLYSFKNDITDNIFITPKTPSKKVVYKDMVTSTREDNKEECILGDNKIKRICRNEITNKSNEITNKSNELTSKSNELTNKSNNRNDPHIEISDPHIKLVDSYNELDDPFIKEVSSSVINTSQISSKLEDDKIDDLPDCNINNKIGEGDFFTVYKILDYSNKEEASTENNTKMYKAVKKSKSKIKNLIDLEFYQKEAEILKSLNSNYIPRFYKSYLINSFFYIEMEYCNLGNLRGYINEVYSSRKESFSIQVINRIMYDLSCGLRDIHEKGIVHLDIKPENILIHHSIHDLCVNICSLYLDSELLTKNIYFKISDFNISRPEGEDIILDGDKKYMAPEVLRNVCHRANDIYSLGLIYIEMLRGINLPSHGEAWLRLRKGDFRGIKMNLIGRKMLSSDYKIRPAAEDLVRIFK